MSFYLHVVFYSCRAYSTISGVLGGQGHLYRGEFFLDERYPPPYMCLNN